MKRSTNLPIPSFFKAKLPYLDPKSKGTIELGTVISFIKYSGLPPNIQKKILDNLKITGICIRMKAKAA